MGDQHVWTISQVEDLIGLPRRDIQRCCYTGKGGVALLFPADSTWGRRAYSPDDLARLYLVARMKDRGMSLPEIKRELDGSEAAGTGDDVLLGDCASRLVEAREQVESLLLSAQALLCSDDPRAIRSLISDYICRSAGAKLDCSDLLERLELFDFDNTSSELRIFTLQLLDTPGFALAIELWLGPGSAELLAEGIGKASTHDKRKETEWTQAKPRKS